ncbi:LysM peptidoglycan-binding domain-containing protein [Microvirga terricola]|uniref:LysM peptidoglycan-binding domain-containing protein n=1 Tax=Microvirga terricola TaxID=2719797 RepID=A0ABX0VAV6_9HYPH|nr:LysM peptidoglycan-binding domain-containing protein [Microvirga terricola]NIX76975.1 LysM peptidoglycan-binding domain-containing protein [Microvirga terricola]
MANEKQVRGTIAILGAAAVSVVAVLLGVLYWETGKNTPVAKNETPGSGVPPQASQVPSSQAPVPQAAPAESKSSPPAEAAKAAAPAPIVPSFDVVRVEPDGESVIAGRAAPGATIELLRGDQVHARAAADASGLFALVPPPLPPGTHQIILQSIAPDGSRQRSRESVTVVISPAKTRPLVALTAPDKPTVLLSNPEPPEAKVETAETPAPATPQQQANAAPGTNPQAATPRPEIKIVSVESAAGRLFVSGQSAPGATVRLYLNDTFIAPGGAGGDGKVSFSIASGVRPGDYRVRLDDVDPVSGQVKSRAEVAFNVPAQVAGAEGQTAPAQAAAQPAPSNAAPQSGGQAAPAAQPGTVVIPNINTAIVSRGDNLWRISQRTYGEGYRYTVIYGANQDQIRNPNLIYPGQVFVLPNAQVQRTN